MVGSGRQITVAAARPAIRFQSRLDLNESVVHGVVAGDYLYVVERVEQTVRLGALDLAVPGSAIMPLHLNPQPRGSLHLARMDDYLIVAEDGHGLRILELPSHDHHGEHAHSPKHGLEQIGLYPLREKILAVTASLRTIYVTTTQELIAVDASVPAMPALARRIPLDAPVQALAANGSTVYLLGIDGLRLLDLNFPSAGRSEYFQTAVQGSSMFLNGRTLYIASAGDGLHEFRDSSALAETFFIQVGDVFFNPAGIVNINAGDTVEWQKPATAFTHNVFSCNSTQFGCGGVASTETFTSGGVTTSPFNFSFTFILGGDNPYLCQSHATTMQGNIRVTAGPPAPPGVPNGADTTIPMTASKTDAGGTDLSIAYEPTVLGGTYGLTSGRCAIGSTSPFVWTLTPIPTPGDFVWWVIVADDGASTEGSWGKDSSGGERDGSGANGASGLCANTAKDITNTCGQ